MNAFFQILSIEIRETSNPIVAIKSYIPEAGIACWAFANDYAYKKAVAFNEDEQAPRLSKMVRYATLCRKKTIAYLKKNQSKTH